MEIAITKVAGDLPPPCGGDPYKQGISHDPRKTVRYRKIDDASAARKGGEKAHRMQGCQPSIPQLPFADCGARSMIAGVEMGDLEMVSQHGVPEDEGCGHRHTVVRRRQGSDNDEA